MTLSQAWDSSALVAALKAKEIVDGLQMAVDFAGVVLGWVSASLVLAEASQPLYGILIGFIPQVVAMIEAALPGWPKVNLVQLQLTAAWDLAALEEALKKAGLPDVEVAVNDGVSILFDWINSSLAMSSNQIVAALAGLLGGVEALVMQQLQAAEAKIQV